MTCTAIDPSMQRFIYTTQQRTHASQGIKNLLPSHVIFRETPCSERLTDRSIMRSCIKNRSLEDRTRGHLAVQEYP